MIYASPEAVRLTQDQALEAGAAAVTSSPTELRHRVLPASGGGLSQLEARVADALEQSGVQSLPTLGSVDFVIERGGDRIGIEVRHWQTDPTPAQVNRAQRVLRSSREEMTLDRIILVTPEAVSLPEGTALPAWLTLMAADDVPQWLAEGA